MRLDRPAAKIALAILAPLVFFALLEGFFRVTGLFRPPRLLEKVRHQGEVFFATNPDYARLFLERADIPSPPPVWVPARKPAGVRRVLLLGESAAAGFPMTDHHLGRLVQARWNARFPGEPVEVVNLSMVAVNSHALREFAREAMVLDPDMIVLYAGHNEVIGPFGPAAKFGPPADSPALSRLSLALRRTHTGRAVESLPGFFAGKQAPPPWRGLDEFRGVQVAHDDPALDRMLANTEANFRDIIRRARRHGAGVLFVLPAINLEDWPPVGSEPPDAGGVDAVLAAQEAGDLSGFRSAAVVYEAAQQRRADGDLARAWPLYRRAADLDTQRLRADSRVRGVQRQIASEAGPEVAAVDADLWLHELNPSFTTDREFFLEHVHLTFAGRAAVAELTVDGMAALWGLVPRDDSPEAAAAWWRAFPAAEQELRRDVYFTGYDEHDMWSLAWKLLRLEVFAGAPGLEERRDALAEKTRQLQRAAVLGWDTTDLIVAYDRALLRNPADAVTHFTAGRLLGLRGEGERAGEAFAAGFALQPNFPDARFNYVAMQLQRGRTDEARAAMDALRRFDPDLSGVAKMDAAIALREGDTAAAASLLQKHLRLRPEDAESWRTLAILQRRLGRPAEAEESQRRAEQIDYH
jgi:tetratricopeptide (TPR) repeat protein/lysophospholipase L1-like esterase